MTELDEIIDSIISLRVDLVRLEKKKKDLNKELKNLKDNLEKYLDLLNEKKLQLFCKIDKEL